MVDGMQFAFVDLLLMCHALAEGGTLCSVYAVFVFLYAEGILYSYKITFRE